MSRGNYTISKDILIRLFKAIKDKGLKQVDISRKIGISEAELSEIKNGRQRINFKLLEGLLLHFNISIDTIITCRQIERRGHTRRASDKDCEWKLKNSCLYDRRKNGH